MFSAKMVIEERTEDNTEKERFLVLHNVIRWQLTCVFIDCNVK